ncbi:MAG: SPOR domain-containing protein [Candidatus Omnitrophota bacterium]
MKKGRRVVIFVSLCLCVFVSLDFVYALNLDSLKANLLKGNYKEAINEGEKILAGTRKDDASDELYYLLGLSYLKDGNYLRASDIFEIILKELNSSRFKEQAKIGLADTYLLRQDFNGAEAIYKELLSQNPGTKYKAVIFSRLSRVGFKKGDPEMGKEYRDKLKQEFPKSFEAKLSEESGPLIEDTSGVYFTVQVGVFNSNVNAQNLAEKLALKGYASFIEETLLNEKKSYRVRVGKLKTLKEAKELENKLRQEGFPTKICP